MSLQRRTDASLVSLDRAPPGLHLEYLSAAEYQARPNADVLGVAAFNGASLDEAA